MLLSVLGQSYGDWWLCLADDASTEPHVREILARFAARDPRIRVKHSDRNEGIVGASHRALAMAGGEFVALLGHDDALHPDALAHVAEAIDRSPEVDYVYTDEDKADRRGLHSGFFFQPDRSPARTRP